MIWGLLDRWRERRAEAAVRRQLAAIAPFDRVTHMDVEPDDEPVVRVFGVNAVGTLLAECRRADGLAGDHGGFVTTARIRQILGGGQ